MQFTVTTPGHAVTESVMVLIPKVGAPQTQPWAAPKVSAGAAPQLQPSSDGMSRIKTAKPFTVRSTPQGPVPTPAVDLDAPPATTASPNPDPAVFPFVVSQTPPPPPPLPDSGPQAMAQQPASAATAPFQQTALNMRPQFQPAVAISQVMPKFPDALKSAVFRPVIVEVRVSIDQKGKVVNAESVTPKPTNRFFVDEALHVVRLWRFQPARRGNEAVESEVVLQFVFKP
jgi:periplasmic protein TonB